MAQLESLRIFLLRVCNDTSRRCSVCELFFCGEERHILDSARFTDTQLPTAPVCSSITAKWYRHTRLLPWTKHNRALSFGALLTAACAAQDEVSLYSSARERRKWDKLSEFFAIIKTTEHLENARIKSAVGRDEVTRIDSATVVELIYYQHSCRQQTAATVQCTANGYIIQQNARR